ncbi:MAG: hypothetical protein PSX71_01645 [bacterium]|nr:hypothetical protein [bacterium]
MKALWVRLWLLCRMRRGPEELPYSVSVLCLVLLLDMALGVGSQLPGHSAPLPVALAITLLAAGSDALVLWGLLRFKQRDARYVQSLTAIYGTDFLLGLLVLPLLGISLLLPEPGGWLALVVFAQMLVVGWGLGVRGFVYHRALDVGIFQGNMLSLTLFFLNIFMVAKLFPELLVRQ